jgi:hypothetical protein
VRFTDFDIDDESVAAGVRFSVEDEARANDFEVDSSACDWDADPAGDPKVDVARQQELLRTFATPFFDAYLRHDDAAKGFLEDDIPARTGDTARYEFDSGR